MTKEAMKLALDALIGARAFLESDAPVEIWGVNDKAITSIKEALAQHDSVQVQPEPEQEPVAWKLPDKNVVFWEDTKEVDEYHVFKPTIPLYTTPPQRKPLTDEEIEQLEQDTCAMDFPETVRAIEAKLKQKNGYAEEKNI